MIEIRQTSNKAKYIRKLVHLTLIFYGNARKKEANGIAFLATLNFHVYSDVLIADS